MLLLIRLFDYYLWSDIFSSLSFFNSTPPVRWGKVPRKIKNKNASGGAGFRAWCVFSRNHYSKKKKKQALPNGYNLLFTVRGFHGTVVDIFFVSDTYYYVMFILAVGLPWEADVLEAIFSFFRRWNKQYNQEQATTTINNTIPTTLPVGRPRATTINTVAVSRPRATPIDTVAVSRPRGFLRCCVHSLLGGGAVYRNGYIL